jgi:anti-sigma factor ChrR (cupin superfamily)
MKENPADLLSHVNKLEWIPLYDDIAYKLLRISEETGTWTVIFRCKAGSHFAPHFHHGAGEFYVISGRMRYRAGEAVTGDYGYEPLGVYHEKTDFPEDTDLLFTNHGPIAFVDDEKNITGIMNYAFVRDTVATHQSNN